ncbi:oxidoreductase domain protein [Fibrisoma limi BUZ 3]|uniref:Oxidoreductase domain protein n=1 Tax=Fibrisoma limi BUZ 3 TaxID=1185876 RepID=I2GCJ2_9BACT|nr:bi-domain-containing oxidoreductase [Fibrisoma limi]CCH51616.1 oxidoreductase domain protein [Fibrisoma limi BUZ 3]
MKQLVQNLKTGETVLEDVPAPQVRRGQVLIRTRRSLVSLGTERMLVEFGKASLIAKARQQPDKVKQVLDKIRTDGLVPTLEAVFRKLDQPLPLGYCNVGEVIAVGEGVLDIRPGDRVASNGPHAEVVCVPRHLVAQIPDGVSDDEAAFTVIGAIGLQGIRLLNPTLGETVVVIGLGLIGLLTADLLRLNGCRVIGVDLDETKVQLARDKGIQTVQVTDGTDVVSYVMAQTNGIGADGVLLTASTGNDELISQAARMSRKRGRLVLVGVVGLTLNRAEFYEKELTFQVSCSYGPGRYDDVYEQQGHDYPLPFVRWTENRNFQTILQLLSTGQLDVKPLITDVVPLTDYRQIYDRIGRSRSIASLLRYPESIELRTTVSLPEHRYVGLGAGQKTPVIGIIGAGNFTGATLLPALQPTGAALRIIASAGGLNGTLLAKKFAIAESTTDYQQVIRHPEVDIVVITTRHNSHARMTSEALRAGKHVFVEKPLVIFDEELPDVVAAQQESGRTVLVGFNRRFAPHVQRMKAMLGGIRSADVPMNVVATMNAGFIPASAWVHDRAVGGGRLLGEACHFVDLITFLTGSRVAAVCMNAMGSRPSETVDSASLLLRYENGSTGVVNYFANGSKAYAKERVEVYAQERTLILDNFRSLKGYGFRRFSGLKTRQNKGHKEQFRRLVEQVRTGGEPLIPFADIVNTTQATLAALRSLREGRWVAVEEISVSRSETQLAV